VDAVARLLTAFNEIEDHFRKVLRADKAAEFGRIAQSYIPLAWSIAFASASPRWTKLLAFARLLPAPRRSAIA
jgi:hypothetical protein